ncbi:MAG: glycosyl transferase family 2 [Crocinitomicaceae bacterium]|jgi:glycosyltransferase involved in cell wall biosynthesis|nr:glycosyl transferase family 2 [Crocinitomicaceae bacterium]
MLSVYVIFIVVLLACYLLCLAWPGKKTDASPRIRLDELSVVIPFRNEAANLQKLFLSISQQEAFPAEIIFVDDHSDDEFRILFEEAGLTYQLIHLETGSGKKAALKKGISRAKGTFILTLDADIELPAGYFKKLESLTQVDLTVLPVKMKSENLPGLFAALDFYFLNALNTAISNICRPIAANGANLLFSRESYEKMLQVSDSSHISSGDDMFLLKAVLKSKGKAQLVNDQRLTVETNAPSSLSALLHQRLRWIGKTKHVNDPLANFIGVLGLVYHVSGLVMVAFYPHLYWILFLKAACDFIVFFPYLLRMKQAFLLFFSPVFTFLYPVYMLIIAFGALLITPEWKQRRIAT